MRPDALLSNGQRAHRLFGYPRVAAGQMLEWIADWVRRGGASLGKPTRFESRDGAWMGSFFDDGSPGMPGAWEATRDQFQFQ